MTAGSELGEWESSFATITAEWQAVRQPAYELNQWSSDFAQFEREYRRLVDSGLWLSGHDDLLSVIGRRRHELTHSAAIAWLLRPTARHRLGLRLLVAICRDAWPDEPVPEGPVTVRLEVDRRAAGHQARADIVVRVGDTIIVIENKVDAREGARQAERLHSVWSDQAEDVRWLLLSPDGRMPTTSGSDDIARAWGLLSYGRLTAMIEAALAESEPSSSLGRRSAEQYLETLRSIFGRPQSGPAAPHHPPGGSR